MRSINELIERIKYLYENNDDDAIIGMRVDELHSIIKQVEKQNKYIDEILVKLNKSMIEAKRNDQLAKAIMADKMLGMKPTVDVMV